MRASRRQRSGQTISDVARLAGVSPMTVSRVINGAASVRQATRDAVNAAIAELDYVPNPAARMLAGGRQERIGLLYSNPSAAYLSEMLVGIMDQASARDVQLVVEKCPLDAPLGVARHLIEGGVDGLILPSPLCDSADLIDLLMDAKRPAVGVGSAEPMDGILAIGIDEYAAAYDMTRHILSLGHRNVGFISGSPAQLESGRRLEGFRAAVGDFGLSADRAPVEPGLFTYRSGLDAAERLLDRDAPPSAIFACNDDMAAATVAVAHRRGLDVPGDLTVCGFDDTTLATTIWPELTTIHQPIADMSRAAVDMLVTELRSPSSPKARRLLDFRLVRRQSDAAPRRRPSA